MLVLAGRFTTSGYMLPLLVDAHREAASVMRCLDCFAPRPRHEHTPVPPARSPSETRTFVRSQITKLHDGYEACDCRCYGEETVQALAVRLCRIRVNHVSSEPATCVSCVVS